jgi:phage tail-like protein
MQEVTDLMLYGVDRFVDIFDPDIAPEVFVDAMLADLGNPFPFVLDLVKKRQLVKLLVPLYKQKGTRPGILAAIRFFVELDLTITTYTGTDMRLGLSRLGEDWILGPGNSFSLYAFTIVSPVALSAEERTMITFIANYMRVAHEHLVRIVEPTEPVAPDDPLVLGSSQLGGTNGLEWLLH